MTHRILPGLVVLSMIPAACSLQQSPSSVAERETPLVCELRCQVQVSNHTRAEVSVRYASLGERLLLAGYVTPGSSMTIDLPVGTRRTVVVSVRFAERYACGARVELDENGEGHVHVTRTTQVGRARCIVG